MHRYESYYDCGRCEPRSNSACAAVLMPIDEHKAQGKLSAVGEFLQLVIDMKSLHIHCDI